MVRLLPKAIAFTPMLFASSLVSFAVWMMGSTATLAAVPTIFMGSGSVVEADLLAQLSKGQYFISCLLHDCDAASDRAVIQTGDKVATHYQGSARQVVQPGDTHKLTLKLDEPIYDQSGQIIVPANSLIEGEIVPIASGSKFVASRIITNETTYTLTAEFSMISDTSISSNCFKTTTASQATPAQKTVADPIVLEPNKPIELASVSDVAL